MGACSCYYASMATLVQNKKIHHDYTILEEFEAGVELYGHEVKSLRDKHGTLEGAHVLVRGREAFLVNMNIPPYQPANTPESYDQKRARRLLLSKKEISKLEGLERQQGLTIVPISMYTKGRFVKVKFAVAKGKKKHDKREMMKERSDKKRIERTLKNQIR